MSEYILAHDLGTTGNKATLYNREGKLLSSHTSTYDTYYPRGNWVEQDPSDWWNAVVEATRKLLESSDVSAEAVEVVCFSGQMMGCLPVNESGQPLRNAIIWADQRGVDQADQLKKSVGMDDVYRITGHRISSNYSAAKVMWIRDEEPEVFQDTHLILQAKDYAVYRLTGQFATDYSDASGTNMFDLQEKTWSEPILEGGGIPREILPEAYPSTEIVGEVTSSASEATGLPEGTPVVIGGGDGSCAATGAGVVSTGTSYNYLGSSSWIALATPEPIYDPDRKTFNWVHLDPEMYSPCGTMQTAGGSVQWARDELCQNEIRAAEIIGEDPYRLFDMKVSDSPVGARGLLFLPYLIGERSPHWNPAARGVFVGLTRKHKKKDLLRSVIEGVTLNLRIILEAFEKQGASIEEMIVIGGGAESTVWRSIMADVYGTEILLPNYLREATSLGAAIAGGVGVGMFDDFSVAEEIVSIRDRQPPDHENTRSYDELLEIFKRSYEQLTGVFDQLTDWEANH